VKKRFSVEQITAVLQQAAQGVPIGDLCRKVGISEQSFYRWKKVYGSLQPSEARELKQLRDENTKLKRLVADLSLDKVMLQDIVQKILKPVTQPSVIIMRLQQAADGANCTPPPTPRPSAASASRAFRVSKKF